MSTTDCTVTDDQTVTMLSKAERKELARLEKIVEEGVEAFWQVGRALFLIHDAKLYRETHPDDFNGYCHERWGFTRQRGYQLITAFKVGDALSTRVDVDGLTERHCRELARLPEGARAEAWENATADGHRPTAADVRDEVDDLADRINAAEESVGGDEGPRAPRRPKAGSTMLAILKHCDKSLEHVRAIRDRQLKRVEDPRLVEMLEEKVRLADDVIEDLKTLARSIGEE